jgi:hypothetical protein
MNEMNDIIAIDEYEQQVFTLREAIDCFIDDSSNDMNDFAGNVLAEMNQTQWADLLRAVADSNAEVAGTIVIRALFRRLEDAATNYIID